MGAILMATNNGAAEVKNLLPHYATVKDKDQLKAILDSEFNKIGKIDIIEAKYRYLMIA